MGTITSVTDPFDGTTIWSDSYGNAYTDQAAAQSAQDAINSSVSGPTSDTGGGSGGTTPDTTPGTTGSQTGTTIDTSTNPLSAIGDWIKANPGQAAKLGLTAAALLGGSTTTQNPAEQSAQLYATNKMLVHTPISITNKDGTTRTFDPYGSISVSPMARSQIAYTGNPTGAGLPDAQGRPTTGFQTPASAAMAAAAQATPGGAGYYADAPGGGSYFHTAPQGANLDAYKATMKMASGGAVPSTDPNATTAYIPQSVNSSYTDQGNTSASIPNTPITAVNPLNLSWLRSIVPQTQGYADGGSVYDNGAALNAQELSNAQQWVQGKSQDEINARANELGLTDNQRSQIFAPPPAPVQQQPDTSQYIITRGQDAVQNSGLDPTVAYAQPTASPDMQTVLATNNPQGNSWGIGNVAVPPPPTQVAPQARRAPAPQNYYNNGAALTQPELTNAWSWLQQNQDPQAIQNQIAALHLSNNQVNQISTPPTETAALRGRESGVVSGDMTAAYAQPYGATAQLSWVPGSNVQGLGNYQPAPIIPPPSTGGKVDPMTGLYIRGYADGGIVQYFDAGGSFNGGATLTPDQIANAQQWLASNSDPTTVGAQAYSLGLTPSQIAQIPGAQGIISAQQSTNSGGPTSATTAAAYQSAGINMPSDVGLVNGILPGASKAAPASYVDPSTGMTVYTNLSTMPGYGNTSAVKLWETAANNFFSGLTGDTQGAADSISQMANAYNMTPTDLANLYANTAGQTNGITAQTALKNINDYIAAHPNTTVGGKTFSTALPNTYSAPTGLSGTQVGNLLTGENAMTNGQSIADGLAAARAAGISDQQVAYLTGIPLSQLNSLAGNTANMVTGDPMSGVLNTAPGTIGSFNGPGNPSPWTVANTPPPSSGTVPPGTQPITSMPNVTLNRSQIPFTGDFLHYGQGPEHKFYNVVNPLTQVPGSVWDKSSPQFQSEYTTPSNENLSYIPPSVGPSQSQVPAMHSNVAPGQLVTPPPATQINYGGVQPAHGTTGQYVPPYQDQTNTRYAQGGAAHGPLSVFAQQGIVRGASPGQADDVNARLSHGEWVADADTVSALGDGNTEAGAKALDKMRENLRKHKRSAPPTKIPPKAKTPEAYMQGGKR